MYLLPDLSKPLSSQNPLTLLSMAVFGEARGEGLDGKLAVAWTPMNRIKAGFGPNLVKVLLKPFQFSCFNDNDPNREKLMEPLKFASQAVWQSCFYAASEAYSRFGEDPSFGAVFYHDSTISEPPKDWGPVKQTAQIGQLTFYRMTEVGNQQLLAA